MDHDGHGRTVTARGPTNGDRHATKDPPTTRTPTLSPRSPGEPPATPDRFSRTRAWFVAMLSMREPMFGRVAGMTSLCSRQRPVGWRRAGSRIHNPIATTPSSPTENRTMCPTKSACGWCPMSQSSMEVSPHRWLAASAPDATPRIAPYAPYM